MFSRDLFLILDAKTDRLDNNTEEREAEPHIRREAQQPCPVGGGRCGGPGDDLTDYRDSGEDNVSSQDGHPSDHYIPEAVMEQQGDGGDLVEEETCAGWVAKVGVREVSNELMPLADSQRELL